MCSARVAIAVIAAVAMVGVYYRYRVSTIPGVRVTSWWRTPWKNERVGGVLNSRHQLGLAFDVVPATRSTISALREIGFKKVLDEGDHIHVEVV